MQQRRSDLKPPPVSIGEQAQQGDIQAIAALLHQKLQPRGITAQGNRKGNRVGILLESDPLPPQQALLKWLHQELTVLNPGIVQLEVYARLSGQRQTAWQAILDLTPPDLAPLEFKDSPSPAENSSEISLDGNAETNVVPLSEWLQQGAAPATQSESQPPDSPLVESVTLTQFLRFYFTPEETALMPLTGVKEILKVPLEAVLPVPQMPTEVLGVYHCRGEILWLVDLGQQVGLGRSSFSSRWLSAAHASLKAQPSRLPLGTATAVLTAIVIEVGYQTLGLVVPDVLDVESHPLTQLQSAPANLFSPQLLPFLQGYLSSSNSPILSLKSLINDPRLQVHR